MNTMDCGQVQELAAELALGTLTGSARASALEHLEGCAACRRTQSVLAEAVDVVLLVAPSAEPPAGFETRVLARLHEHTRDASRTGRSRVSIITRWVAPVAAVAAAVVAGLVLLVTGPGTTTSAGGVEVAAMHTGMGAQVGTTTVYDEDPTRIVLSIPAWTGDTSGSTPRQYFLAVEQADGPRELVELPASESTTWEIEAPIDARDVESVAVVDGEGRIYCSARFTD